MPNKSSAIPGADESCLGSPILDWKGLARTVASELDMTGGQNCGEATIRGKGPPSRGPRMSRGGELGRGGRSGAQSRRGREAAESTDLAEGRTPKLLGAQSHTTGLTLLPGGASPGAPDRHWSNWLGASEDTHQTQRPNKRPASSSQPKQTREKSSGPFAGPRPQTSLILNRLIKEQKD